MDHLNNDENMSDTELGACGDHGDSMHDAEEPEDVGDLKYPVDQD